MGKISQSSVKYVIKAKLESGGMIEKPDVVGAIFGQTEGLLGDDLDLRELQERGRVGRIDVKVSDSEGSSSAEIEIPTSLDATETSLLAASLETIDRVGPTNADIRVEEISDRRTSKRDYIVKRAKQLLEDIEDSKPEKTEITEEVKKEVRTSELSEFKGFSAGPEAQGSEEVVLVEGRADLLNLMEYGIKNAVALGGTSVPSNIEKIKQEKTLTAFLDGDRGGDLILKELEEKAQPDYVARAPDEKEVEELGKEQVFRALRDKEPAKYTEGEEKQLDENEMEEIQQVLSDLVGTRAVVALDQELEPIDRFPLNRFQQELEGEVYAVVFDGEVDNDKIEKAEDAGADYIAGMKRSGNANSSELEIVTREQAARKVS